MTRHPILLSPDENPGAPQRPASVVLRRDDAPAAADSPFDPANQSLADALRVMYRLLQFAMVVLFVLFILSGITSVKEGQRGVRLLFGRVQEQDLDPGFRWSAPYPMGQVVTVDSGVVPLDISREFWVLVSPGMEGKSLDDYVATDALRPGEGGSGAVITGDGNLAHTQWKVSYRRTSIGHHARNVLPENEQKIVKAAAMRGVVQACAQVTVDDLLKQTNQQADSVANTARRVAQQTLDRMDSGITIDSLTLSAATPPLLVRPAFAKVQSSVSNAAKELENARATRRTTLNAVAGDAATLLVGAPATADSPARPGLIDRYEDELAAGNEPAAARTLAAIESILAKQEVEIDGVKVTPGTSGEVRAILDDADRYRKEIVARYQGDVFRFRAKLAAYRANPSVMIQSEWRDALTSFYKRDTVQVVLVPPGTEWLELLINRDPRLQRAVEKARKDRDAAEAERLRRLEFERDKHKTPTGVTTSGS